MQPPLMETNTLISGPCANGYDHPDACRHLSVTELELCCEDGAYAFWQEQEVQAALRAEGDDWRDIEFWRDVDHG